MVLARRRMPAALRTASCSQSAVRPGMCSGRLRRLAAILVRKPSRLLTSRVLPLPFQVLDAEVGAVTTKRAKVAAVWELYLVLLDQDLAGRFAISDGNRCPRGTAQQSLDSSPLRCNLVTVCGIAKCAVCTSLFARSIAGTVGVALGRMITTVHGWALALERETAATFGGSLPHSPWSFSCLALRASGRYWKRVLIFLCGSM
mmetsp:Transcript_110696/g.220057  ORF Transcript_110696/g.220057 Transcript_110696/m.220057 type:complete len:202 (+) Transcript_110696:409-1014(+)